MKKALSKLIKIDNFSIFFHDRHRLTAVLWVIVLIFGSLSYSTLMKREGFPAINAPFGMISGTADYNSANKIDGELTLPIVNYLKDQPEVKDTLSTSRQNDFNIQIELEQGTDAKATLSRYQKDIESTILKNQSNNIKYIPIEVGKINNDGDDLLVALYSTSQYNPQLYQENAQKLVNYLKNDTSLKDIISGVSVKEQLQKRTQNTPPPAEMEADSDQSIVITPTPQQEESFQANFDIVSFYDKEKASTYNSIIVGVKASPEVDTIELYNAVNLSLEKARQDSQFQNYDFRVVADFAESITSQINSLQENMLGGLIAVLLISFALISLRASIVTALSMTTVLALTIGVLYAIGYSLNTITLFSLILSLGLIVDDTTIVAEAIDVIARKKKNKREAIKEAVRKVALASSAGTFTTILAFAPMLFISGILGQFIKAIPITIILSLCMSLLVSLTLIPFFGKWLLIPKKYGKTSNPIAKLETLISHKLADLIIYISRSRKTKTLSVIVALTILLASLFAGANYSKQLTFNIFPAAKDSDQIAVSINFNPNTSMSDAQKYANEVTNLATTELGENYRRASLYGLGDNYATILYIDLVSYKDRNIKSPELIDRINSKLNQYSLAKAKAVQIDVGPPGGNFAVRLVTDDQQKAEKLATDMKSYLTDNFVTRPDGSKSRVTEVTVTDQNIVSRQMADRYIEVSAKFEGTDTSTIVTLAQDLIKKEFTNEKLTTKYQLPEDVINYDFGSESDNQESFGSMLLAFPALIVIMYLLLALQFRSLSQPLLIFLAIPFSFIGVTAGLYYTDNPFSFFTMIGFFALIGIAVNNTILLTDYANQEIASGMNRYQAISSALRQRFRPLITTSLTSVVALVPLAISDPFWESLAYTLIFGLLSSTVMVILIFPYFYLAGQYLQTSINRKYGLILTASTITLVIVSIIIKFPLLMILIPLFWIGVITRLMQNKLKLN